MTQWNFKKCFLVLFCLFFSFQGAAETQAKKVNNLLFVVSAKKGQIKEVEGKRILTLTAVEPKTLWFTDRPRRKAGYLTTKILIQNWSKSFYKSNPNAGMLYDGLALKNKDINRFATAVAVELKSPSLSDDNLTFKIKEIGKRSLPANLENVILFIDDGGGFFANGIMVGDHQSMLTID